MRPKDYNYNNSKCKIMIKKTTITLLSLLFIVLSACSDDDSENENNENPNNPNGTGTADVSFSGELNETLGDYATWEITEDQLLRIRIGDRFPDNIVMNYDLSSNDVNDFDTGTYQAVNATGTGMGSNTMAFQYNNSTTYFPDSGTITINAVNDNTIEGEINVTMSPVNGQSTTDVTGSFTASILSDN